MARLDLRNVKPLDDADDPSEWPDYSRSCTAGFEDIDGQRIYSATIEFDGIGPAKYEVDADEYRVIDQYEAARRRQAEAQALAERRWKRPEPPPPPEPAPEEIPPAGKLTGRQEEFCRQYLVQPVATRAAVLAGYSEESAATLGSRLLKNPLVLDRIARLRNERSPHYVLERDTLHDKLEAVFFEARGERNHAAAIAALRLQAGLAGLILRPASPAKPEADEAPPAEKAGRARKPRRAKVEKSRGGRRKRVEKSRGRRAGKVEKSR